MLMLLSVNMRIGKFGMADMNEDYFEYLNDLRESGEINMMDAGVFLQGRFGLDRHEARAVLLDWMDSFDD